MNSSHTDYTFDKYGPSTDCRTVIDGHIAGNYMFNAVYRIFTGKNEAEEVIDYSKSSVIEYGEISNLYTDYETW